MSKCSHGLPPVFSLTWNAVDQRLCLPSSSLARWVREPASTKAQSLSPGPGPAPSEERDELNRLRKERGLLRTEKDFSGWRQRTLP